MLTSKVMTFPCRFRVSMMSVRCSFPTLFGEGKRERVLRFMRRIIREHGIENKRWWKYILRREVFMMASPLWENFPLYDRGSVSLCDAVGPHFSKDKVTFVLDSANRSLTCVRVFFCYFFTRAVCAVHFSGEHVNRVPPTQVSFFFQSVRFFCFSLITTVSYC